MNHRLCKGWVRWLLPYARTQFWLVLWDPECPYCMKSLESLAAAQRNDPQLKVVTISTDPMQSADEIAARLEQPGVRSDAYAFGDAPREALQYAIDATWLGEKPTCISLRQRWQTRRDQRSDTSTKAVGCRL